MLHCMFQEHTHWDSHIVENSQIEFTVLALELVSIRLLTVDTRFSLDKCARSEWTQESQLTWILPVHVLLIMLISKTSNKERVCSRQIKSCSRINGQDLQLITLPTVKELLDKLLSRRSRNWVVSGFWLAMPVRFEGTVHVSISFIAFEVFGFSFFYLIFFFLFF